MGQPPPDVKVGSDAVIIAPTAHKPEGTHLTNSATAFQNWPGGAVIAHYVVEKADALLSLATLQGAAVLELGSGTGLAGLASAAALKPVQTTLTDLGGVLPQVPPRPYNPHFPTYHTFKMVQP